MATSILCLPKSINIQIYLDYVVKATRQDMGALFENYMIAERLKQQSYARTYAKGYFWRTAAKQKIDYIEERNAMITAFEFKWNPRRKASVPPSFAKAYPDVPFRVITRDNYWEFLSGDGALL